MEVLRIKEVLKEKGFTQIDLANELGISKVGVNKIINGNPTVDTLQKIAQILNIDIKDLFVSSKGKDTLYIERGGEYLPIGELKLPESE